MSTEHSTRIFDELMGDRGDSGIVSETSGNTWWVCNSATVLDGRLNGSNGNDGLSPMSPFETIDYAVSRCVANKGDVIKVMEGHTENVNSATALQLDVAGVRVEFLGEGSGKAKLSFSTITSAAMTITAAGVTLVNPRFEAAIDGLTGPISITAADLKIIDPEYYDATDMNTVDAYVASAAADRLKIYNPKFFKSNEGGTQKQSHIQVGAAGDVEIINPDINGDFATGNIENTTAWARARIKNPTLNNTNATPKPTISLAAASAGIVEGGNLRVASGVLFVSAVNQMEWRDVYGTNTVGEHANFLIGGISSYAKDPAIGANTADNLFDSTNTGANADGSLMERAEYIQSSIGAGLGAAVAAIQTDLGNPSIRTNLKTIEAMLGNPDSAGATIYDAIGSGAGLVSYPAAAPAGDGVSVAEVARYIQESQLGTLANTGGTATVGGILGDVNNSSVATRLTNAQTELDKIGTIVNTGGTATLGGALGDVANVSVATNLAKIGTITNTGGTATLGGAIGDVANISVATRLGNIETETDLIGTPVNTGGTAEIGAMLGDFANISLVTRLGVPVTSVSADIAAVKTEADKIGTIVNTGGTATIGGILGDFANVTAVTKLTNIQNEVNKVDSATLAASPTAGSLARFIASGGTALGTPLADSKSLVDALGTNGTTVADSATSVLGAIGANNANNAFDSSTVISNPDGSVLERAEDLRKVVRGSEGLTLKVTCDAGMVASTTSLVSADLIGYGNDLFNNKYYVEVIKNTSAVGTMPEGFTRQITDYDSATGTLTVAAFPGNVEASDVLLIKHDSLAMLDSVTYDSTLITAAANGSLMEVAKYIEGEVNRISAASLAVSPVAGSLGRFIASGGTALGTELADSKSLVDALGTNGTTVTAAAGSVLGACGTQFVVRKMLTSSNITQAGVDITGLVTTGALLIKDIYINTDATGLAAGTNFQITTDNTFGITTPIFEEAVANLGANKTESLATGSVAAVAGGVLGVGKKLIAKSTVADCTGGGQISIDIVFQRVLDGALVLAA